MATIELDVTLGDTQSYEKDLADYKNEIKKFNLKLVNIVKEGPGGGWPEVTLEGSRKDIERYLRDSYGDPDLAEYIDESSFITTRLNELLLNESDVTIKRFANESEAAITLPNGNITYTTDAGKTWETKYVNEAKNEIYEKYIDINHDVCRQFTAYNDFLKVAKALKLPSDEVIVADWFDIDSLSDTNVLVYRIDKTELEIQLIKNEKYVRLYSNYGKYINIVDVAKLNQYFALAQNDELFRLLPTSGRGTANEDIKQSVVDAALTIMLNK